MINLNKNCMYTYTHTRRIQTLTTDRRNSENALTIFDNWGLVIEERFLRCGRWWRIPRTVERSFIRQLHKKACQQKQDPTAALSTAMLTSRSRHEPKVVFINRLLKPVHHGREKAKKIPKFIKKNHRLYKCSVQNLKWLQWLIMWRRERAVIGWISQAHGNKPTLWGMYWPFNISRRFDYYG